MGRPTKTCAATKSSVSARTFAHWLSVTRVRLNRPPDASVRSCGSISPRSHSVSTCGPAPCSEGGRVFFQGQGCLRLLAGNIEAGRDIDLQPPSIGQRESHAQGPSIWPGEVKYDLGIARRTVRWSPVSPCRWLHQGSRSATAPATIAGQDGHATGRVTEPG